MSGTRGGASVPPFPSAHSGPVLVCGNAWCLSDDLDKARRIFPDAPAIAVNGASGNVRALALFSLHPDKFPGWIKLQKRFHDDFSVHGVASPDKAERNLNVMPWVDHWWQSTAKGTSTWAARKVASYMGFGPVVLCGMPLEKGGYQGGKMAKFFQRDEVLEHYRAMVAGDIAWHAGALSMSGWTRDLLGAP